MSESDDSIDPSAMQRLIAEARAKDSYAVTSRAMESMEQLKRSMAEDDRQRAVLDLAAAPPVEWQGDLGVALSGGGYRATMHGLGALLYLVDAGLHRHVTSIVSVSGGSIASAAVAADGDFSAMTAARLESIIKRVATHIVGGGVLRSRIVRTYVVVLSIALLLAVAGVVYAFAAPSISSIALAAALVMVACTILLLRGAALMRALRQSVVGSKSLGDIRGVDHVFCATDLNHGLPVFFRAETKQAIWPGLGSFDASQIGLDVIVRSSAAFPGGFPPKRLHTGRFVRGHNTWMQYINAEGRSSHAKHVGYLADGGVWNNLATTWWGDIVNNQRLNKLTGRDLGSAPKRQLVVDSATSLHFKPTRLMALPMIGELAGLGRVMRLLYYNTVKPRTEMLLRESGRPLPSHTPAALRDFVGDQEKSPEMGPVVVRLEASPADLWAAYELKFPPTDETVEARARIWRRHIGKDRRYGSGPASIIGESRGELAQLLDEVTDAIEDVPTTLGALDRDTAINLLTHGYFSTMAGCWIVHGVELDTEMSRDRFEQILAPATPTSTTEPADPDQ